jgi:hypothetical protein
MVRAAQALWRTNIQDIADGEVNHDITMLFDENGWDHWLRDEDKGGCPDGYTRPPDPDYCGHTVAWFARHVGDHLDDRMSAAVMVDPELARTVFPSTYRLSRREKWEDCGHTRPAYVAPERVAPGDIVVVGDDKSYGDHITLCIYPLRGGKFATIEGNATGQLPDGTQGKGVIKRKRTIHEITRIYRLDNSHFIDV